MPDTMKIRYPLFPEGGFDPEAQLHSLRLTALLNETQLHVALYLAARLCADQLNTRLHNDSLNNEQMHEWAIAIQGQIADQAVDYVRSAPVVHPDKGTLQ